MTALSRRSLLTLTLAGGATLLAGPLAAQTARVPVRVGIIPIIGAAPLFVAQGEGWLREAGLDLTVTTFESGPNMIQALASGTIDVYVAGVAPLGVARAWPRRRLARTSSWPRRGWRSIWHRVSRRSRR
jgi:NitT/TauT family transport system substrate-binding protein